MKTAGARWGRTARQRAWGRHGRTSPDLYDIDSFEGSKIGIKHDRFIEVKGTTSSHPIFYWSENEREVAQKLGERYFIYIWTNVGKVNQKLSSIIKNPYHEIVEKKYKKIEEIITWRINWHEDSLKK